MKNPKLIVKPFAKNGQKNVIPENYETSMESNQATWDQGFGQITMLPVAAGGLPPKGQDFNGIFNQISENIVYLSQGGRFKFSAEYAEAIGGYPKGAILQSDDEKKEYLSLIDNNKVDFNTATDISASWKLVNTDDLLAQIASKQPKGDYATKTELNSGLAGKQPTGDYATKTEVGLKLDKTAVVQGTGSSTTNVMNQKSVTDELKNKASNTALTDGLNKKFDKTGGKITASGKAIEIEAAADTATYIQITDTQGNILHQLGKTNASNDLFLRNVAEGGNLVVNGDGVRFNGNLLGFNCEALTSSAGYITIPTFTNGVKRNLILQWRYVSVPESTSGTMASTEAAWPIPFPSTCISIMCSYSGGVSFAANGTPFCSTQIVDRATFKAGSGYSKSAATLVVWGLGY
ncbi:gp53-like domain-containing protein [Morganella morganii]|uniref:gp53-like domain-containing protein n=1 Tax=Morganella morganii TaxID=582 RepID=UPI00331491EC